MFEYVRAVVAQILDQVGPWPTAGTPLWCELPDDDPRKLAAAREFSPHHALRVEVSQEGLAQASRAIADAEDWSDIATEMVQIRSFYEQRPWLKRRPDAWTGGWRHVSGAVGVGPVVLSGTDHWSAISWSSVMIFLLVRQQLAPVVQSDRSGPGSSQRSIRGQIAAPRLCRQSGTLVQDCLIGAKDPSSQPFSARYLPASTVCRAREKNPNMYITRLIAAGSVGLALVGCSSTRSSAPSTSVSTKTSMVTAAPSTITAPPSTITLTIPPPPAPMDVSVRNWLKATKDHLDAIVHASDAMKSAVKNANISGLGAACQNFHDGVQGLQGHMPTPDEQLTTALQAALSDYDAGTHFCIASTQDHDVKELKHSLTFLDSANNYMEQATAILDRDLGTHVTIG